MASIGSTWAARTAGQISKKNNSINTENSAPMASAGNGFREELTNDIGAACMDLGRIPISRFRVTASSVVLAA
jgi:hypothetical protein